MNQLSEATQVKLRELVVKVPEEQHAAVMVKAIMADFDMYRERNLMIKDKVTGAIMPFTLNWAQAEFVRRVIEDLVAGEPVRYIILKARQLGISTVIEALCFWWTATHRNISSVIMAHDSDAAKNLYEMFRRFYQNAHPLFQPTLKYNTKSDLTFDVEDDIKMEAAKRGEKVPGLSSRILTAVAKEGKGRSQTNHFFHGSEVAFWEDSADTISGVLQTVPLAPRTFAFLESTANGVGNYFFNEWMSAEKGESTFKPFFLPWWKHDEYELAAADGGGPYNDFEQELRGIFIREGIDEETAQRKIAWARRKQLDFRTDPKKFFQEYPHTPMVAFLSSGNYAFPVEILIDMLEGARQKPFEYGELSTIREDKITKTTLKIVDQSPLKIWYKPMPGLKYVVGGDVAEGITVSASTGKEGDYSVATVMEVQSMTVVARWRGHIDPDLFGDIMFDLGTYYNNALLAPEVNNHGIVVLQKLINRFYRNLYRRETSEEHQFQEPTAMMGWKTTRGTKGGLIKTLAAAYRERDIKDFDPVAIGEAMTYMQSDKGAYDGKANGHDDCVISTAICVQLADWSTHDVQLAKDNIHKDTSKIKKHATHSGTTTSTGDSSDTKFRYADVRAKRRAARATTRASRR